MDKASYSGNSRICGFDPQFSPNLVFAVFIELFAHSAMTKQKYVPRHSRHSLMRGFEVEETLEVCGVVLRRRK